MQLLKTVSHGSVAAGITALVVGAGLATTPPPPTPPPPPPPVDITVPPLPPPPPGPHAALGDLRLIDDLVALTVAFPEAPALRRGAQGDEFAFEDLVGRGARQVVGDPDIAWPRLG